MIAGKSKSSIPKLELTEILKACTTATNARNIPNPPTKNKITVNEFRRCRANQCFLSVACKNRLHCSSENPSNSAAALDRVALIDKGMPALDSRLTQARDELARVDANAIDGAALREQLAAFDAIWEQLTQQEQARLVGLVIAKVTVNAAGGTIEIEFRGTAPKAAKETA